MTSSPQGDVPATTDAYAAIQEELIRALKRADALRVQAEAARAAIEAVGIGLWDLDVASGQLHDAGQLAQVCGGTAPTTLEGFFQWLHVDDRAGAREAYERTLVTGEPWDVEARTRGDEDQPGWIWWRGTVIETRSLPPARLTGIAADLTDRKRAQADAEFRRRLVELQAEAGLDGLLVVSDSGQILYSNRRFAEMWDLPPEVVARGSDEEALRLARQRVADPDEFTRRIEQLYAHPESPSREEVRLKDGRVVDGYGAPVLGADGRLHGWLWSFRDVTSERQAQEAIREASRQKDQFLAMLAHELRNPLAPVLNAAETLARQLPRDSAEARAVSIIARQAQHLSRLVNDLLDVSRLARGNMQLRTDRLDFAALVRQRMADLDSSIRANELDLVVDVPDEPAWIDGDQARLAQVIDNIVWNAVKFTDPGGTITVRMRSVADEGENGEAVLSIRDTGVGMDERMLSRMFEIFSQADESLARRGGGLGLGMPVARQLVEEHGGRISAGSDGIGKGAELEVRLRLVEPPREATEAAVPASTPPHRSLRVLIIEDNPDVAEALALVVETLGHEPRVVTNGAEGIRAGLAEESPPQVVLCDIGLASELDGYGVARRLRAAGVGIYLVALTGYGRGSDQRAAAAAGFDRHLTKPVSIGTLEELLAEVAERVPRR